MIDMGHALPMELKAEMVATARKLNPDFAFWDENFSVTQQSRDEGYNAVFGFCWVDQHHPDRMRKLCERLASEGFPIPVLRHTREPQYAARGGASRRPAYARWTWRSMQLPAGDPVHPFGL